MFLWCFLEKEKMSYILDPYTRKSIAERFVTRGYHTDELIAALNGDDLALLELLGQLDRKPKGEVHRGQVFVTTYFLTQDKYPVNTTTTKLKSST